jgi:hypothetical protein
MANKRDVLKSQLGQSAVEYIFLIAVIMSIVSAVFNSNFFKDIFGEEGSFATVFKAEIEYSYRHGLRGNQPFNPPNYVEPHDTYVDGTTGRTRFFSHANPYPGL